MAKINWRRLVVFHLVALVLSLVMAAGLLVAADLYLHYHFRDQQGYNWRGYRGELLGRKRPGELRVACFGGSTTYGYGVHRTKTWPFFLQGELHLLLRRPVSVVNLGANNQGIYGIFYDIKAYKYLDYDLAVIYNGYNDIDSSKFNTFNFRGGDSFFQLFGYKPILPLYLTEKAVILMYGQEKLAQWYRQGTEGLKPRGGIRFKIGLGMKKLERLIAWVNSSLQTHDLESKKLALRLGRKPYGHYLTYLSKVFDRLILFHKTIVYICQPGMYDTTQQKLVRRLIADKYPTRVKYLNFSTVIDRRNRTLCSDGMHLTPAGNKVLAHWLAAEVARIVSRK